MATPEKQRSRYASEVSEHARAPYENVVHALSGRYPNLSFLKYQWHYQRAARTTDRGRAGVIEFRGGKNIQYVTLSSPSALRHYLEQPRTCNKRLFLIEDLATDYVEVIGGKLVIDPYFFEAHLRTVQWEHNLYKSQGPHLQSNHDPVHTFVLRYHECILIENYVVSNPPPEGRLFTDSHVRRSINFERIENLSAYVVGLVQRSVSFWSKTYDDDTWDSVILTDPPISDYGLPQRGGRRNEAWEFYPSQRPQSRTGRPQLFQGGYIDVSTLPRNLSTLEELQRIAQDGPSRFSMFDDIVHYWLQQSKTQTLFHTSFSPVDGAIFAKRIALANWMVLLEYLQRSLREMDYSKRDFESAKKILRYWIRQWPVYQEIVQSNMLQLGLDHPSTILSTDPTGEGYAEFQSYPKEADDWYYVVSRLTLFALRSEALNTFMMNENTAEESKNVGRLTKLGSVFLPLGFASGLLSMAGDFQAGRSLFWVFWAISIPVIVVLFLLAFAPNWKTFKHLKILRNSSPVGIAGFDDRAGQKIVSNSRQIDPA